MNPEELEILLEGGTETQTLDFKESCPWATTTFAKDILAMANVQGGGSIIIGVIEENDGSYTRQGILSSHKGTYSTDIIMDDMSKFADPFVQVSIKYAKDKNNTEYVILLVEPFREIPVICKKDSKDTKQAGIYYRNRDGRSKSALISNSFDMRDLIERAVTQSARVATERGFILPRPKDVKTSSETLEERLKKERGDL